MATFPRMAEIVAPGSKGVATVEHYDVTGFNAAMASVRGIPTAIGKVAVLRIRGTTMMSDTLHERSTNAEVVRRAEGDVLIAGLGLGMILHPILARPEVDRVTVVERHQDVIDLILPTIPDPDGKLEIVCADIFAWRPPSGRTWDVIYFDIWPDLCTDNLAEMATLHRKFARRKVPGGWMESWCRAKLKRRKRREMRSSW